MYVCKTCSKSFEKQLGLNAHQAQHKSRTGLECPVCKKGFNHRLPLAAHVKKAHPVPLSAEKLAGAVEKINAPAKDEVVLNLSTLIRLGYKEYFGRVVVSKDIAATLLYMEQQYLRAERRIHESTVTPDKNLMNIRG